MLATMVRRVRMNNKITSEIMHFFVLELSLFGNLFSSLKLTLSNPDSSSSSPNYEIYFRLFFFEHMVKKDYLKRVKFACGGVHRSVTNRKINLQKTELDYCLYLYSVPFGYNEMSCSNFIVYSSIK